MSRCQRLRNRSGGAGSQSLIFPLENLLCPGILGVPGTRTSWTHTFGKGNITPSVPSLPPPDLQSSLWKRETTDKPGSLQAGGLVSSLHVPTSEVEIVTAHPRTPGMTSRPRGSPARGGTRREAQASFIVIIRSLSCSRGPACDGCWHYVPENHTTFSCPTAPSVLPSTSTPG